MKKLLLAIAFSLMQLFHATAAPVIIVVEGAAGTAEYGKQFSTWATRVTEAASLAEAEIIRIGKDEVGDDSDKSLLQQAIVSRADHEGEPLWIFLLGHGTFYRNEARFNLRGPDVRAEELATWLQSAQRTIVIVNASSGSGPFVNHLAGENRAVVTATRNGNEQNFARFGDFFSQAFGDTNADLDHDDEVSLLEAFLMAAGRVNQFYESDARLVTEHAILDDNGDGVGTPASFFRGIRPVREAKEDQEIDGRVAKSLVLVPSQRSARLSPEKFELRGEVELAIERLRAKKEDMAADEYFAELNALLVRQALLYER